MSCLLISCLLVLVNIFFLLRLYFVFCFFPGITTFYQHIRSYVKLNKQTEIHSKKTPNNLSVSQHCITNRRWLWSRLLVSLDKLAPLCGFSRICQINIFDTQRLIITWKLKQIGPNWSIIVLKLHCWFYEYKKKYIH